MRKILLVFIFLFLAQAGLKAQQDPYFSTYLVNPSLINSSLSSTYDNNNVVSSKSHLDKSKNKQIIIHFADGEHVLQL